MHLYNSPILNEFYTIFKRDRLDWSCNREYTVALYLRRSKKIDKYAFAKGPLLHRCFSFAVSKIILILFTVMEAYLYKH